jgi:pyruvate dehydrogenase E2 component (dihydrolipoamide acetyltransferase)
MNYEFKLPDIGEGVVEGEIVNWLVHAGDEVEEDQPMVEVMTDKATVEIPAPVGGTVSECLGKEGDVVEVGATLVVIETSEEQPSTPEAGAGSEAAEVPGLEPPTPAAQKRTGTVVGKALATPAVRKLAGERGIDLTQVQGTGPGGRIVPADLDRFSAGPFAETSQTGKAEDAADELVETIPYRGLRRKIGAHLSVSKRSAVHYTYVDEVDATELVNMREGLQEKEASRHITYLPLVLRAIISGLKEFPLVNAFLDEEKEEIKLKRFYNIGIATATPEGLIVPVLRNADQKTLLQLSDEIQSLVDLARQGKARVEDLRGGTFTVTSLGTLGGLVATPVINYPEVAILGVHKIAKRPAVRDDQIVIRQMMNLSLSLDHRVVDGVVAAQFLQHVIQLLENPESLVTEEDF